MLLGQDGRIWSNVELEFVVLVFVIDMIDRRNVDRCIASRDHDVAVIITKEHFQLVIPPTWL